MILCPSPLYVMVVLVPPRFSGSSIVIFHGQPVFSVVGEGRADSAPVLREHVSVRIVSEGDPCRPILNGDNCALGVDRHGDRLGAFGLDRLEFGEGVQGGSYILGHWGWLKSCGSELSLSLIVETSTLNSGTLRPFMDERPGHLSDARPGQESNGP